MGGDAVAALIGGADGDVNQVFCERVERAWAHDVLEAFPGAAQRGGISRESFPEVVDGIDFARRHDVVEDGAHLQGGVSVLDGGGRHGPLCRVADQDAGDEDQYPAEHHLQGGANERGLHIMLANPTDGAELNDDHADGQRHGDAKVSNHEGQGVANATDGGHDAGDNAADDRATASGERAIVGQSFGKGHGDAGSHGSGEADEKGVPAFVRGEGGGEERGKGGHGAVHEAREAGLDELEDEGTALDLRLIRTNLRSELLLADDVGGSGVFCFRFGQIA